MLKVSNLCFSYRKKPVLRSISFSVGIGENVAIIGESGSGKSTLLNLLYGKHDLNSGSIYWKDTSILGPSHNLVVGYEFMKQVSQEFDLMPFITVGENIGKHLSNFFPEDKGQRIGELIAVVGLQDFEKTKVKNLSGGQKQRVALARALAKEPEIILLDEPFSHIDNFKKQSLRRSLFRYLKDNEISCLVATHDKDDVMGFADRMIVLDKGEIAKMGSPQTLYKHPETKLVASFFGEFNLIEGLEKNMDTEEQKLLVYAHQLRIVDHSDMQAEVKAVYFNGHNYLIEALYQHQPLFFYSDHPLDIGKQVMLAIDPM